MVDKGKMEELMKKHPPWFMLGVHPIRHAKRLLEEEEKIEKEMNEVMGKGKET